MKKPRFFNLPSSLPPPPSSDPAEVERYWLEIGLEAHRAGRLLDAEKAYRALLAEVPTSSDGLHLTGLLIKDGGGDLNLAASMIESALDFHPERAGYWYNLGVVRISMNDSVNAEHSFRRALSLKADYHAAWMGLADALLARGRFPEARGCVQRIIDLNIEDPLLLARIGAFLANYGEPDTAEWHYMKAIALAPDLPLPHSFLSVELLRQGRYAEGWVQAEHRLGSSEKPGQVSLPLAMLDTRWPRWQGENLSGRRLLLSGEQGYGDVIQFTRFAKSLHERGCTVDAAGVFAPLASLIASAPGINRAYPAMPDEGETYDFWIPMWSLPCVLGITAETIPAEVPYLFSDVERVAHWKSKIQALAGNSRLKVGLVWAGRKSHANNFHRSLSLRELLPLASVGDVAWFSLQVDEEARAQLALLEKDWPIHDLGSELANFSETAAVVENLDLVIAVDTSVVHLCGALNRPAWVLLPAWGVDWRWMRKREDSPWYPSLRLFRQQEPLRWETVVQAIAKELGNLPVAAK